MQKLRYILFPFSILYAFVTEIRNLWFDKQILKSRSFDIPIINVGNLSVGGTGKTPQIEYLINLLQNDYKIAVLSRGYKRQTKGFIQADNAATPEQIGDEPYQIKQKFPDIIVAVDARRAEAVRQLLKTNKIDIILLDDAYQHRSISAGLNIVLTPYNQLFTDDYILPVGNLRECKKQIKRADVLVVSKCPKNISIAQKEKVLKKIHKYFQKDVFFSSIDYQNNLLGNASKLQVSELQAYDCLLVTGIANPEPLYSFLSEKSINFEAVKFGDHHQFSNADLQLITKKFQQIKNDKKIVLTTEKDFVRLHKLSDLPLYYLPIKTQVFNNKMFNNKILDYVRKEK